MTEFVCKYCNKVYKTEKGFNNHKCKERLRYDETNDITLYVFSILNSYYFNTKLPQEKEDIILTLIHSRYYDIIKRVEKWAVETLPINFLEYVNYLKKNLIPFEKWTTEHTYHCFLYQYLKSEPEAIAITRGEQYLKKNNITMETISSNRLWLAIKYGHLSKKYLDYINYNPKNNLDDKQWESIRSLFISEYQM